MTAAIEAICPDHRGRSTDFVALNAKQEPVFRCSSANTFTTGFKPTACDNPPHCSHYFTVCSEAKARLADTATKKGGKR